MKRKTSLSWKRQNNGANKRYYCFYCLALIQEQKYDLCIVENSKIRAHYYCGLKQLSSINEVFWKGKQVLHPMEQWSNIPNWKEKPDFGIVQYFDKQTKRVYFAPFGSKNKYCLNYQPDNLWTRERPIDIWLRFCPKTILQ